MSIDQLDLILYDMYRMDAWLPPLFGKWTEDYKKRVTHNGLSTSSEILSPNRFTPEEKGLLMNSVSSRMNL